MERKYCLKLAGRFAGNYEIFSEEEISLVRRHFHSLKQYAQGTDLETMVFKLCKVFEIRTPNED